jgi:hypothetical protein
MPFLKRLRDSGFSIWPFDSSDFPMVVEIYPRGLTGPVNKGSAIDRAAYLDLYHPDIDSNFRQLGASSEDAFDALVSALVMADHVSELIALLPARDDVDRLEGRIWLPDALQGRALQPPAYNRLRGERVTLARMRHPMLTACRQSAHSTESSYRRSREPRRRSVGNVLPSRAAACLGVPRTEARSSRARLLLQTRRAPTARALR